MMRERATDQTVEVFTVPTTVVLPGHDEAVPVELGCTVHRSAAGVSATGAPSVAQAGSGAGSEAAAKVKAGAKAGASGAGASGLAIIYVHGGGFLYGERDDLPRPYLDLMCAAGHTVLALDYPLAPECPLEACVDATTRAVAHLVRTRLSELGCTRYVLFGRSAGAYLVLAVGARLCGDSAGCGEACGGGRPVAAELPPIPAPSGILDFYGYHDLTAPFVWEPSGHYAAMPAVSADLVAHMADAPGSVVVTSAPKATRYGLYLYARQTGRWGELLGLDAEAAQRLSLSPADIAVLPPVFLAASTGDNDVPFGQSKALARAASDATMYTVYYLDHDFDRDTTRPEGRTAYERALAWLAQLEPTGAGDAAGAGGAADTGGASDTSGAARPVATGAPDAADAPGAQARASPMPVSPPPTSRPSAYPPPASPPPAPLAER